jgi:hypothetical protein
MFLVQVVQGRSEAFSVTHHSRVVPACCPVRKTCSHVSPDRDNQSSNFFVLLRYTVAGIRHRLVSINRTWVSFGDVSLILSGLDKALKFS